MSDSLRTGCKILFWIAALSLSACSEATSRTNMAPTTTQAAPASEVEAALIRQVRSEAAATTAEITWVDTVTDSDLVVLFRTACVSFVEGATVTDQAQTFIDGWAEHATVRPDDRRMANFYFDAANRSCRASASG